MREHEDALDIAQAVLLKAWRGLPGFDARSRFSSWLFALTRNECLTALRPRLLKRDESADPAHFLVDDEEPARLLESAEEEEAMATLLRETPQSRGTAGDPAALLRGPAGRRDHAHPGLTHASGARSVLQSAREKLRRALALQRSGNRRELRKRSRARRVRPPGPLPEGANLPDAEARLLGALEQELGVKLGRRRSAAPAPRLLALAAAFVAAAGLLWSLGSLKHERENPSCAGRRERRMERAAHGDAAGRRARAPRLDGRARGEPATR
jgi:hypothetical protein